MANQKNRDIKAGSLWVSGLQGKNPKGCGRRKMAAGERKEDSKGESGTSHTGTEGASGACTGQWQSY